MTDYFPRKDARYKEFHGTGFGWIGDPKSPLYLTAWNDWAQCSLIKKINCKWEKAELPFHCFEEFWLNKWYELDGTWIWTLGDAIGSEWIGEVGWQTGLFFPPLAKLKLNPVIGETITPQGWSVDLRNPEPKTYPYPEFFYYRTLSHHDAWGPWKDVWRTALKEFDTPYMYNYFWARDIGLVQFLQVRTDGSGKGKVWILDHLLEDEKSIPEPIPEPPYIEPATDPFPAKARYPTNLYTFPASTTGSWEPENGFPYTSRYLQAGVAQILLYGFDKPYIGSRNRIKFKLMNGSLYDGSAPLDNPEHTGGTRLDFRYPLTVVKDLPETVEDINWIHFKDLVEYWVEIRNELYPEADIKILLYQGYLDYLQRDYADWCSIYKVFVRFVGTTSDYGGDRAHKLHCDVQILGVK
uniref:Uncharacterized protein n=1 Tax=viral metagenome TaxID=1070528 RepID=A0A6M3JBD3_9ZZZZ